MVYLQQDAFDAVDSSASSDRQKLTFNKVYDLVTRAYRLDDRDAAREYFTRLTGLFKTFNYAAEEAPAYDDLMAQIGGLAAEAPLRYLARRTPFRLVVADAGQAARTMRARSAIAYSHPAMVLGVEVSTSQR